jgi:hypothetical protein
LGVRTVMVTGDAPATAAIVAKAVGLDGKVCPPGPIPVDVSPEEFAVFAGILPEGKYNLVKAFQKSGHICQTQNYLRIVQRYLRIVQNFAMLHYSLLQRAPPENNCAWTQLRWPLRSNCCPAVQFDGGANAT